MTTIDKLGVQGIRSFSPENLEVISFEKPLTLIVGHNGAGKTTLVESLKMVCTGELPPNSDKGKSFIFEPKIANQPHVKAQIRLIFKTFNNKKVCAIRSFQLSNAKDKNGQIKSTFKALESVLQIKAQNGETRSVSNKCADMDAQVPQLMGVSKAILENVIFCHQEDSCWPLGDMQKLKKKFDDLFGATRYTKALKAIDDARKEQREIHKEKLHQFECIQTHLQHANKFRNELENCESFQKKNSQKIFDSSTELQKLQEEIIAKEAEFLEIEELCNSLQFKKEMKKNLNKEIEELHGRLSEVYEEPLEELLSFQEKFRMQAQEMEKGLNTLEDEKRSIEIKITSINENIQKHFEKSADAYKAEERKENAEKKLQKILDALRKKRGKEEDESASVVSHVEKLLAEEIETQKQKLKEKECENREALNKKNNIFSEKNAKLSSLKSDVYTNKCLQERLESEIAKIEKEVSSMNEMGSKMKETEKKMEKINNMETENKIESEKKSHENELDEIEGQMKKIQIDLQNLEEKKAKYDKDISIHTEIDIYKNQLGEKGKTLEQTFSRLSKFFVENFEEVQFNDAFVFGNNCAALLLKYEDLKMKKNAKLQAVRFDLAKTEEKISNEKKNYEKNERTKTEFYNLLNSVGLKNMEDVAEKNDSLNEKERKTLKDLITSKNAEQIYHNFLSYSEMKNKCAFCTRSFGCAEEVKKMKMNIDTKISQLPQRINELEHEHASILEEREKFDEIRKKLNEFKNFEDQFTASKQSLTLLNTESGRLKEEEAEVEKETEELDKKIKRIKTAENEIANYKSLYKEKARIQECIEELSEKLEGNAMDNVNIDNINKQIRTLQTQKSTYEKEREVLFSKIRSLQQQLSSLHIEKLGLENEYKSYIIKEEKKKSLLCEKRTKEKEIEKINEDMPSKQDRIDNLESEVAEIKNEIDENNQSFNKVILNIQKEIQTLNNDLIALSSAFEDLKAAEEDKEVSSQNKKLLDKLNEERQQLLELAKGKGDEISEIKESIEKNKHIQQMLSMNLDLCRMEEKSRRLEDEIQNIQTRIGVGDISRKKKEIEILKKRQSEISCEIARLKGIHESKEEEKKRLKAELSSSIYTNIDQKASILQIETQSHALAITDLAKYHKALDKALMKYHATKMQEINRRLRELWQNIYSGNDIDYVAVRSDTDGNSEISQPVPGLRSYNYRVVMIKGGNEIDMRGRCSSGQKVLCSILIRLTLTEIFCQNCKILTLDEPTTNLDQLNIQKLASSLCELIEMQSMEKSNMQLIIITHDEEFVSKLSARGICDYYYRISKDNHGFSVIHKADITHF